MDGPANSQGSIGRASGDGSKVQASHDKRSGHKEKGAADVAMVSANGQAEHTDEEREDQNLHGFYRSIEIVQNNLLEQVDSLVR